MSKLKIGIFLGIVMFCSGVFATTYIDDSNITTTGNTTSDWFFGMIDWADVQNPPTALSYFTDDILWIAGFNNSFSNLGVNLGFNSTYNATYDALVTDNSSWNQSLGDGAYWRLDGTNAPPSANWDMGTYGFSDIGASNMVGDLDMGGNNVFNAGEVNLSDSGREIRIVALGSSARPTIDFRHSAAQIQLEGTSKIYMDGTSVQINDHLIPYTHGNFDLGSSVGQTWRDLWISRYAHIDGDINITGQIFNPNSPVDFIKAINITNESASIYIDPYQIASTEFSVLTNPMSEDLDMGGNDIHNVGFINVTTIGADIIKTNTGFSPLLEFANSSGTTQALYFELIDTWIFGSGAETTDHFIIQSTLNIDNNTEIEGDLNISGQIYSSSPVKITEGVNITNESASIYIDPYQITSTEFSVLTNPATEDLDMGGHNISANYGFFDYLGSLANKIGNLFVSNATIEVLNVTGKTTFNDEINHRGIWNETWYNNSGSVVLVKGWNGTMFYEYYYG